MDFASSGYARDFFQGQVPQIIRSLKSIADSQQKLFELQMQQNSSVDKPVDNPTLPAEVIAEGIIYVCYEENSTSLYADAGNINHMFVTADVAQALGWAKRSLSNAEANNYLPITDDEMKQFISEIGREQYASVWVYRNQDENAKENYGICVDCFEQSKSAELLTSVFA